MKTSKPELIERLLKLISLLTDKYGHKIEYLAEQLEIDKRSIHRYFVSMKNVGLVIENNDGYRSLKSNSLYYKELTSLLHFSEEENFILQDLIYSIDCDNQTKMKLQNKLAALYSSDQIAYSIIDKSESGKVKILKTAIDKKKRVILKNYRSSNGNKIENWLVEPHNFTSNYIHVWGFATEYKKNYLFRLSRIETVETTEQNIEFSTMHKSGEMDVFRMNSDTKTKVKLELTLKAYNYLIEDYPMAKSYIIPISEQVFLFDGWYHRKAGISKFILSVINYVKVIEPQSLKDYLNKTIQEKTF